MYLECAQSIETAASARKTINRLSGRSRWQVQDIDMDEAVGGKSPKTAEKSAKRQAEIEAAAAAARAAAGSPTLPVIPSAECASSANSANNSAIKPLEASRAAPTYDAKEP